MPIPLISPQLVSGLSEMLWEFGFRHHADLQVKWIDGGAGLGMVANIKAEAPKRDPLEDLADQFLSDTNPQLLEAIRKAPPEEREKFIKEMEKQYTVLGEIMNKIKDA